MLFNSYFFILVFLPLCIAGYFALSYFRKFTLAQLFLLGMSLWFYGYNSIHYLFVIIASIVINYCIYFLIYKYKGNKLAKVFLITGVVINICILLYFKYMDFFIENINTVFRTDIGFLRIALPLGISFFTFQQVGFIADAYRKEIPKYNFLNYACFVSFFPQLIAGPIVSHDELLPQFLDNEKKKLNADNLAKGIYIFVIGLAKKVLIADVFGELVSYGYLIADYLNSLSAVIVILAYTIQIYFDFSGYCDMAIGIGKMLNIDLPQNFDSPYKSLTITEFWERWHKTLTRFFTKYVYIPLGGNREGAVRTYVNIMIVFLISGFWHGASWNFVFWGCIHGIFVVVTRMFSSFFDKLHPALNWLITFSFVSVAWVFFRADTFSQAVMILSKAVAWDFTGVDTAFFEKVSSPELSELLGIFSLEQRYPPILLTSYFAIALFTVLGSRNAYEKMQSFRPTVCSMMTTLFLLVWSVFSLAGISTFLYFNF